MLLVISIGADWISLLNIITVSPLIAEDELLIFEYVVEGGQVAVCTILLSETLFTEGVTLVFTLATPFSEKQLA